MQNSMGDPRGMAKRNSERTGANKYGSNTSFNSPMGDSFFLPGMKGSRGDGKLPGNNVQSRTINEGMNERAANRKRANYGGKLDSGKQYSQEREQYYKFYLDSAQKAIEMMRKQHKSASIMKMSSEPIGSNNMINIQPHGGGLPNVGMSQSQYGMYPQRGNGSFQNFDNISNGGPGNNLSPLGYNDGEGSPAKSGTGNMNQRGGRLLEPLFGQQNRLATKKHMMAKSNGGMSAMTQQDQVDVES